MEKVLFYGDFVLRNHLFSFVHKNWSICRIITRHPWKSSPWSQVLNHRKIKWFAHTGTFWRLFKGAQFRRLIAPSFDYKFVPVGANHFIFHFCFLNLRPRAWFSWVCRRCTTSRSKFTCNWNLSFSNDFFLLYFPLFSLPTNVKSQKLTYFDGPKFALYFTYNDVTPMKITTRVSN